MSTGADRDAGPARQGGDPESLAHFRILGRLGEGGMGVVYRAEDRDLRRTVALKVLRAADEDEETHQRFLREARSAAAISHPNVAILHQIGEAEGCAYIAMELVDGESLRDKLRRGPIGVAQARELGLQIAQGLAAAHEKGIVHRDLKPENVMVTPEGGVKLLDFGLAKEGGGRRDSTTADLGLAATEAQVTSTRAHLLGTPEYMSPEQALGEPVDVRSDVFSFGVLLYEMISGRRPFAGLSVGALAVAIVRDAAPPLRRAAPRVDRATEAIVARCLEKDREGRFANGAEIAEALMGRMSRTSLAGVRRQPVAPPGEGRGASWGWIAAGVVLVACATLGWRIRGRDQAPPRTTAEAPGRPATTGSLPEAPRPLAARRITESSPAAEVRSASLTRDGRSVVFANAEGFWAQALSGGGPRPLGVPAPRGASEWGVSMVDDPMTVFVWISGREHLRAWMAPLDGSPARLVHEGAGRRAWPSPDGKRVAVEVEALKEVHISPVEGGPSVTVRSSEVVPAAAFSPDGRHLAFVTSAPESIQVAATDGSSLERTFASSKLYLNGTGGLAWPAPGRLLFGQQADDPGSASLCEIAIDDDGRALGAPRELWKGRASAIESLSTHDETIAAVVMRMHAEVRVADLAVGGLRRTGAPRRFTGTEVNCQDAAWLPDGRLGFFSDRDGKGVLYAQASESAPVTLLVPGEVVPNRLAWAGTEALRTGELIYPRAESPSQPGVRRMVVAGPGGAERELLRTSAPDESWMVRCASGDPHQCVVGKVVGHSITLSPLDAGRGEVGPAFFTGAGVTSFALSPDGKTVVVIDRSPRLTVVDRATGQTRSETTTPGARFFQDAAFTPDGRWLVVSGLEFDDDAYGLAAYDMEGRGAMLVTSRDQWLSGPRVSPDGRRLAYTAKAFAADVWLLEPQTSTTGVRSRM